MQLLAEPHRVRVLEAERGRGRGNCLRCSSGGVRRLLPHFDEAVVHPLQRRIFQLSTGSAAQAAQVRQQRKTEEAVQKVGRLRREGVEGEGRRGSGRRGGCGRRSGGEDERNSNRWRLGGGRQLHLRCLDPLRSWHGVEVRRGEEEMGRDEDARVRHASERGERQRAGGGTTGRERVAARCCGGCGGADSSARSRKGRK